MAFPANCIEKWSFLESHLVVKKRNSKTVLDTAVPNDIHSLSALLGIYLIQSANCVAAAQAHKLQ